MTVASIQRAASFTPRQIRGREGLEEIEIATICDRVTDARKSIRMSLNAFLALDRRGLAKFCARFGITRAEVRLTQHFVEMMRVMRRTSIVADLIRKMRSQSHNRGLIQ